MSEALGFPSAPPGHEVETHCNYICPSSLLFVLTVPLRFWVSKISILSDLNSADLNHVKKKSSYVVSVWNEKGGLQLKKRDNHYCSVAVHLLPHFYIVRATSAPLFAVKVVLTIPSW